VPSPAATDGPRCATWSILLVQADPLDQIDLDLVSGGQATDQVTAADAELLSDRDQRRDVVAGVGVVGGQEGVVEVQIAGRYAVCPGRPLGGITAVDAEDRRTRRSRMRHSLLAGRSDRPAHDGRSADCRVVDDAVDHHCRRVGGDRDGVGGHLGDLVCEMLADRELIGAAMSPNRMGQQEQPATETA